VETVIQGTLDQLAVDETLADKDEIARVLVATGAVTLAAELRYRFGSGLPSPMYVDNRRVLSMVDERRRVRDALNRCVKAFVAKDVNVVVGVPTGGLPWAAWLADDMSLPLVYVRSEPKDRGLGKQIEGVLPDRARALVFDDLVTTGKSSKVAIDAITATGAEVDSVVSIFSYGLPYAARLFASVNVGHFAVSDLDAILRIASERFTPEECRFVAEWRTNVLMKLED
jgi:orotate phosphoribosyltransferase